MSAFASIKAHVYLRAARRSKNGKTHVYWRLVESYRVGSKVRQRIVADLGPLGAGGRAQAKRLARKFLGDRADQREFGEDAPDDVAPVTVRTGAVRVENGRAFGAVWLGLQLWRALQLDAFCARAMTVGRETVAWPDVASILVIARLCEPSSELHIAEAWYRRTALPELIDAPEEAIHHTRLYAGLDELLKHKDKLEQHLRARFGELFALDYELLLYDVTSTFFEGAAARNDLAARGHSRDHRPDCKQVCLALVVTRDGFPLGYEVWKGNTVDVTTVRELVEKMETRHGRASRVWVLDRGMTSEANLKWLRETGRQYVVGTPRTELPKWEQSFLARESWTAVRDGLEVKQVSRETDGETFLLCRSEQRREKEAATHQRFLRRIAVGIGGLARRLKTSRRELERGPIERQIGRLLAKNSRAAGAFKIALAYDPKRPSRLRLRVRRDPEWFARAAWSEGAYILRSNVTTWTPEELWKTYVQLCSAEDAFRIQKSQLGIRPVWHQTTERVLAHILVCFLAFALWKTLEGWLAQARLGHAPRKALDELARIQLVDVVLPLVGGGDARRRCVVRPDEAQAAILDRLGLRLPWGLRDRTPAAVSAQM